MGATVYINDDELEAIKSAMAEVDSFLSGADDDYAEHYSDVPDHLMNVIRKVRRAESKKTQAPT